MPSRSTSTSIPPSSPSPRCGPTCRSRPTLRPSSSRWTQELARRRYDAGRHEEWLAWCKRRDALYPVVQPHHREWKRPINPYHFMETLFERLGPEDVVVTGNGAACIDVLPGRATDARTAAVLELAAARRWDTTCRRPWEPPWRSARRRRRAPEPVVAVVCLAGDGSLQMNIQELQTLVTHRGR